MKAQADCIKEMEQILPAKANKHEVSQQLAIKANLIDIKSTMAEVAANLEAKVSLEEFRASMEDKRSDLSMRLQEKVSFEDMKRYVALNIGDNASKYSAGIGPQAKANRSVEIIEDDVRRLKERLEDIHHQLQSLRSVGGGPSS